MTLPGKSKIVNKVEFLMTAIRIRVSYSVAVMEVTSGVFTAILFGFVLRISYGPEFEFREDPV
jgi:hypothetical protein